MRSLETYRKEGEVSVDEEQPRTRRPQPFPDVSVLRVEGDEMIIIDDDCVSIVSYRPPPHVVNRMLTEGDH